MPYCRDVIIILDMEERQIEAYDNYKPQRVKDMALKAIRKITGEGTLASQEDMLRLYKLLAKYSKKMGSAKIFEKLEEEDLFRNSLKFHLLWAESYAKEGNVTKFTNVVDLAKRRLHHLSTFDVEAGFRDLVDQYLPSCDLFNDDEETMAAFCARKPCDSRSKKSRRRSSLAVIEARAKDSFKSAEPPKKGSFGPKKEDTGCYASVEILDAQKRTARKKPAEVGAEEQTPRLGADSADCSSFRPTVVHRVRTSDPPEAVPN